MVNIVLWELFKRLIKPNALNAALKRMSQGQLEKLVAQGTEAEVRQLAGELNAMGENPVFNKWHSVVSSNVYGIAYDNDRKILYVAFNDKSGKAAGAVYSYHDVSEPTFYSFLYSPSKGRFVWLYFRGAYLGSTKKMGGYQKLRDSTADPAFGYARKEDSQ